MPTARTCCPFTDILQVHQFTVTYPIEDIVDDIAIEAFPQDPGLREQLSKHGFAVGPRRFYQQIHEPYLITRGLLHVTPQGRVQGKPMTTRGA